METIIAGGFHGDHNAVEVMMPVKNTTDHLFHAAGTILIVRQRLHMDVVILIEVDSRDNVGT